MVEPKLKGKNRRGDSASFVDADGNESNALLHEQMLAGVDDTELRRAGADRLAATGKISKEQAYKAVGLPPPK